MILYNSLAVSNEVWWKMMRFLWIIIVIFGTFANVSRTLNNRFFVHSEFIHRMFVITSDHRVFLFQEFSDRRRMQFLGRILRNEAKFLSYLRKNHKTTDALNINDSDSNSEFITTNNRNNTTNTTKMDQTSDIEKNFIFK